MITVSCGDIRRSFAPGRDVDRRARRPRGPPRPAPGDLARACDPAMCRRAVDRDRQRQPQRHVRRQRARVDNARARRDRPSTSERSRGCAVVRIRSAPRRAADGETMRTPHRPPSAAPPTTTSVSPTCWRHGIMPPGGDAVGRPDPGRQQRQWHIRQRRADQREALRTTTSSRSATSTSCMSPMAICVRLAEPATTAGGSRGARRRTDPRGRRRAAAGSGFLYLPAGRADRGDRPLRLGQVHAVEGDRRGPATDKGGGDVRRARSARRVRIDPEPDRHGARRTTSCTAGSPSPKR